MAPVEATGPEPTTSAPDAAVEACIRLAAGPKDEERFLGATLALQHAEHFARNAAARLRLLEALGSAFVTRLLRATEAPYRRIGLGLFRVLALEGAGARGLAIQCASPLALAWSRGITADASAEEAPKAAADTCEGDVCGKERPGANSADDVSEAVEALRQAIRLLRDQPQDTADALGPALEQPLCALAEQVRNTSSSACIPALLPVLALVQELSSISFPSLSADALLEAVCLAPELRGTEARGLALGVLSERIEGGIASSGCMGEVLGEQLVEARAAGLGGGVTQQQEGNERWNVVLSTLRFAAVGLQCQGLALFGSSAPQSLQRLQKLLKLAAGEVHLGLEGLATIESVCAGCMFAEAATSTLVGEAETLEQDGGLQASAECLRTLHRIVRDAYDYCLDLPDDLAYEVVPPALPLVARLVAVWQVEDPMRFSSEFQRSLPALCRLPPAEFQVLLPSIQELQDWHLTPALGKCLELLAYSLGHNDKMTSDHGICDARRTLLQPCALGLAEVALDAAAYLPDAPVPEVPTNVPSGKCMAANSFGALAAHIQNCDIPRPVMASDPSHPGVKRLCEWSAWLWTLGQSATHLDAADRSLLALVCGSLLTSVPEAALLEQAPGQDMWGTLADFVLSSSTEVQSEAAAGLRLALRFCGFALDQHSPLALALVRSSCSLQRAGQQWLPRPLPSAEQDEDDEWKGVDDAAVSRLRSFLKAAVPSCKCADVASGYKADGPVLESACAEGLDAMD